MQELAGDQLIAPGVRVRRDGGHDDKVVPGLLEVEVAVPLDFGRGVGVERPPRHHATKGTAVPQDLPKSQDRHARRAGLTVPEHVNVMMA